MFKLSPIDSIHIQVLALVLQLTCLYRWRMSLLVYSSFALAISHVCSESPSFRYQHSQPPLFLQALLKRHLLSEAYLDHSICAYSPYF